MFGTNWMTEPRSSNEAYERVARVSFILVAISSTSFFSAASPYRSSSRSLTSELRGDTGWEFGGREGEKGRIGVRAEGAAEAEAGDAGGGGQDRVQEGRLEVGNGAPQKVKRIVIAST